MIEVRQDMHVHSTFSDGANTVEENVAEAERLGLLELTCVDHVRVDTDWVADYAAEVTRVNATTPVVLRCAVEAKLLDTAGSLDLPPGLDGVDVVYAADHQVPLADGPHKPSEVRASIAEGALSAAEVIGAIATATANALPRQPPAGRQSPIGHRPSAGGRSSMGHSPMGHQSSAGRQPPVVIAHLFSVLPKVGLSEDDVPQELLDQLAAITARRDAHIEISERWSCPSARTLRPFLDHGVPIVLSTDSHRRETIGRYSYCTGVLAELALAESPPAG
jgi:putative hydrolase